MTAGDAIQKACEVLERAELEPNDSRVEALTCVADSWTRLAEALAEIERV